MTYEPSSCSEQGDKCKSYPITIRGRRMKPSVKRGKNITSDNRGKIQPVSRELVSSMKKHETSSKRGKTYNQLQGGRGLGGHVDGFPTLSLLSTIPLTILSNCFKNCSLFAGEDIALKKKWTSITTKGFGMHFLF